MNNIVAFVTVLIVWSTTPLAIKVSSTGSSVFFSTSSRMFLATLVCFVLLSLKNTKLELRSFWKVYIYSGLGIFITLSLVYTVAKYINSGMIAVVFALIPIITSVFASLILKESHIDKTKIISILFGFIGVVIVFSGSMSLEVEGLYLSILLFAVIFQGFISVKLKQIAAKANSLQVTVGGLLFSLPLFIIAFFVIENQLPVITEESIVATVYLAIVGTVFGFIGYYYLIKNTNILTVGIISLITPIFALSLGYFFSNEEITYTQLIGIIVVILSLFYYQFGDHLIFKFKNRKLLLQEYNRHL